MKQQAIIPTVGGKKNKAAQELEEDKPGTVKRGRRTLVGCLRQANFRCHLMRKVSVNPYGLLKVLKAVIFNGRSCSATWLKMHGVRDLEWRRCVFIEHGWDEFAEATTSKKVMVFVYLHYGFLSEGGHNREQWL
jgi:hypothetical protein